MADHIGIYEVAGAVMPSPTNETIFSELVNSVPLRVVVTSSVKTAYAVSGTGTMGLKTLAQYFHNRTTLQSGSVSLVITQGQNFESVVPEIGAGDYELIHHSAYLSGTEALELVPQEITLSGSTYLVPSTSGRESTGTFGLMNPWTPARRKLFYRKAARFAQYGVLGGRSYVTKSGSQAIGRTIGITTGSAVDSAVFIKFYSGQGYISTGSVILPLTVVDPSLAVDSDAANRVYNQTIGLQTSVPQANDATAYLNRQDYTKTTEDRWSELTDEQITTGETSSSTRKNIGASLQSVLLMEPHSNRRGGSIYNGTTSPMYLSLGNAASLSSFTAKLYTEDVYELPSGWTGAVSAIWATQGSGTVQVVEYF